MFTIWLSAFAIYIIGGEGAKLVEPEDLRAYTRNYSKHQKTETIVVTLWRLLIFPLCALDLVGLCFFIGDARCVDSFNHMQRPFLIWHLQIFKALQNRYHLRLHYIWLHLAFTQSLVLQLSHDLTRNSCFLARVHCSFFPTVCVIWTLLLEAEDFVDSCYKPFSRLLHHYVTV